MLVRNLSHMGFVCLLNIALLFIPSLSALAQSADVSNVTNPSVASDSSLTASPQPAASTADAPAEHVQPTPLVSQSRTIGPAGKIGMGVKVSLLGIGVEAAVPIASHLNVRAGFNMFNYDRTLSQDGVSYVGKLNFRSSEAHLDWFPLHGSFHLSPGLLVYNGNKVMANVVVANGQTITFNGTDYESDPNDPLTGNAKLDFNRLAPSFVFGWGNLVPRSHKHWSMPVELGIIYQSTPRFDLDFSGSACDASGLNCDSVATGTDFQDNLQTERDKLNHDLAPFKFYPVISVGFGYKF
jgi:hypothetical protein